MGSFDAGPLKDALNAILGHDPQKPGARGGKKKKTEDAEAEEPIVSKRDERGTPYRGDFPNPASDRTRGCF